MKSSFVKVSLVLFTVILVVCIFFFFRLPPEIPQHYSVNGDGYNYYGKVKTSTMLLGIVFFSGLLTLIQFLLLRNIDDRKIKLTIGVGINVILFVGLVLSFSAFKSLLI